MQNSKQVLKYLNVGPLYIYLHFTFNVNLHCQYTKGDKFYTPLQKVVNIVQFLQRYTTFATFFVSTI